MKKDWALSEAKLVFNQSDCREWTAAGCCRMELLVRKIPSADLLDGNLIVYT